MQSRPDDRPESDSTAPADAASVRGPMSDRVTELCRTAAHDPLAANELLPLVYDELRQLAAARMRCLAPGQTLQPTAVVHEAYMKLIGDGSPGFAGRRHFFGAAARAMRDVLVDHARHRGALKRGGTRRRVDLSSLDVAADRPTPPEDLVAVHEALERLERDDPRRAEIVLLRFFGGLQREEIADILGVTARTVDRDWRYIVARFQSDFLAEHGNEDRANA